MPEDAVVERDETPESTIRIPRGSADGLALAKLLASKPSPIAPPPPRDPDRPRDTPAAFSLPKATPGQRATFTVLRGLNSGESFPIRAEEVVLGRDLEADIVVDDLAVSRHHARLRRRRDGRYVLEDLESTNGTFVDGSPVKQIVLGSGDRVQLGSNVVLRFAVTDEDEDSMQRRLYESSTRDGLTGIYNRIVFEERLEVETAHARRSELPATLLLLDLDHFKRVNDGPGGHLAGDAVLREFVRRIGAMVRMGDLFARVGGEEFALLLRATTSVEAVALAERVRAAIQAMRVPVGDTEVSVTVSIGVASSSECDSTLALMARADARLYLAKAAGRNRVMAND